jgi:hypothetical protein
MAVLKKWVNFYTRTNLSDNDSSYIMVEDPSNPTIANQDQKTPVTEILRTRKNLSDLNNASEARANITNNLVSANYYVDQFGDDTNGNGSILSPWATVSHAMAQLAASDSIYYTIVISGIITDPNQILLKPNVNIFAISQESSIDNALPIACDPSFNTYLNTYVYYQDFEVYNDLNMDLSFVTATSQPSFSFVGVSVYGNFTIKGHNNCQPQVYSWYAFGQGNTLIQNCNHYSFLDWYWNITYNNTFLNSLSSRLDVLTLGASYTDTENLAVDIQGARISTLSISAPSSLTYTPPITITKSTIGVSATLDGGKCVLNTDVASLFNYTMTNGATYKINTGAFLPPKMTTTQKNAITGPEGIMLYDTTLHKLCVRTASAWETITSA